ncbi:MAG: 2-iminoacetate synthase ThiH [Anaerovoracaceae bacterium]
MNGYNKELKDPMQYLSGMDVTEDSDIMNQILEASESLDFERFTDEDIKSAINKEHLDLKDFAALLSPAAEPFLERIAQRAQEEKLKHFGNVIYMFTPLYIANYCQNHCVYCGFNCKNKIKRARLDFKQIENEMKAIAATGLEEILILTGESPAMSDVKYIGEACRIARRYFRMIGLEIYPVNVEDYRYLHESGADFITVFQETYNPKRYGELHLGGNKRVFPYRFNAQERALQGGMRGVGFGALLGLSDFRKDAYATGMHAYLIQKKYPHAEIAFSCPRLRPTVNNEELSSDEVDERKLLQVITAYRLLLPFAGITVSTRERALFRDNAVNIAATKISAGVSTGIGSHSNEIEEQGDDQFVISDNRSVDEVREAISEKGLQPVMNDYVYVEENIL